MAIFKGSDNYKLMLCHASMVIFVLNTEQLLTMYRDDEQSR